MPSAVFSLDEDRKLYSNFKFALVGRAGRFINLHDIKSFLEGTGYQGGFRLRRLLNNDVLFIFNKEEEYLRFFIRGTWTINNIKLYVFKWTPDYCSHQDCSIVPIWVTISNLPSHFINFEALFTIASTLGKPCLLDSQTLNLIRIREARCCIEIDIANPLPPNIHLRIGPRDLILPCKFEGVPGYCKHCHKLGPTKFLCKIHGSSPDSVFTKGKKVESNNSVGKGWVEVKRKKHKQGLQSNTRGIVHSTEKRWVSDGWILEDNSKKCQATHSHNPIKVTREDGWTLGKGKLKRGQATSSKVTKEWIPKDKSNTTLQQGKSIHRDPGSSTIAKSQVITAPDSGLHSSTPRGIDSLPILESNISSALVEGPTNQEAAGVASVSSPWGLHSLFNVQEHFPSFSAAKKFASKLFLQPEEDNQNYNTKHKDCQNSNNLSLQPNFFPKGSKDDSNMNQIQLIDIEDLGSDRECEDEDLPEAGYHSEGERDLVIWVNHALEPFEIPIPKENSPVLAIPKATFKDKNSYARTIMTRSQTRIDISITHLSKTSSDHKPMLLICKEEGFQGPKPFRTGGMAGLAMKLKGLKSILSTWNKLHFGNIFQEVKDNEITA
ncbi:hypothetical protein DM860_017429 [Cuscuta australis]|uniref:DUF4283 domain-containing protein n=1 Tax=Cuscuta australis TaxID=267555 RepID=A0A328DJT8_9ASTE|nr:hypothetical protein DM860_017429 [Cuscuta australis]